jgi:hypothetical protein
MKLSKSNKSPTFLIGTSVVMFLIVMGFIYAMVRDITTWEMFYDNPVSIDSVVVGNEEGHSRGRISYHPDIVYEYNGTNYSTMIYESNKYPTEVGSHKLIRIDGNNPDKILSDPDSKSLIIGIVLILVFGSIGAASLVQLKIDKSTP